MVVVSELAAFLDVERHGRVNEFFGSMMPRIGRERRSPGAPGMLPVSCGRVNERDDVERHTTHPPSWATAPPRGEPGTVIPGIPRGENRWTGATDGRRGNTVAGFRIDWPPA